MFLMNRELMTTLILDCRMQMSFMLCLKFLSLIQPSLWESLRSPTSNICLLKPGTQSLVVNFPAHWLLIVTFWLRWHWEINSSLLIKNWFPRWSECADRWWLLWRQPLHSACSSNGCPGHTTAAVSVSDSPFLSRMGPGYPTVSKRVWWAIPQIWLSNVRAHRLCTAPLSCPLDGAEDLCFNITGFGERWVKRIHRWDAVECLKFVKAHLSPSCSVHRS